MVEYVSCTHPSPDRSDRLIEGQIVLRCRSCRKFSVDGSSRWVDGGDGMIPALKIIAAERDEQQAADHAVMTTPIEDPRWIIISQ
jgi:hypothetical protein